jgi:hypothetical protein
VYAAEWQLGGSDMRCYIPQDIARDSYSCVP